MELPILALCILCLTLWRSGVVLYLCAAGRPRDVVSTAASSLCELATSSLCFWAIGAAILLQEKSLYFGIDPSKLCGDRMTVLFTLAMVLVGTAPAIGAIAEGGRLLLVVPLAALMSVVIVPVVGQWTWRGVLVRFGGIDIAGALPIVLCPAVTGLVCAAMVGREANRDDRRQNAAMAVGGVLLMLGGWLAYLMLASFVLGNVSLWRTLLDTILAASAGCLAAMAYGTARHGKADLVLALMGMVGGMLSTAAGGSMLPPWFAVLLGATAGLLGVLCATWVNMRWRIGDAGNLNVVMIVSAGLSLVVTPLIVAIGWIGRMRAVGVNGIGVAAGVVVAGGCTWAMLAILRRFTELRASDTAE